jgi:putative ABC transport system substrate-binding protein
MEPKRRALAVLAAAGPFVAGLAALAVAPAALAQSGGVLRIGILTGRSPQGALDGGVHDAFVEGMARLGYVEGKNMRYEWRYAGGHYAELRRMADELVRLKVQVIVVEGSSAIGAAKAATDTIPIVMLTSSDPVGAGFISSLGRPGGNITGLTSTAMEATLKRLEILVTLVPGLRSVAALVNPNNPGAKIFLHEADAAARKFNLRLIALQAGSAQQIEAAFLAVSAQKADALMVQTDALFNSQRKQIAGLAAQARIPAIYALREFLEVGGLLVYGHDIADLARRAALYVDKILKGATPAQLPVEQPHTFQLLINLKSADALGIAVPQSLLLRANEVVR